MIYQILPYSAALSKPRWAGVIHVGDRWYFRSLHVDIGFISLKEDIW